MSYIFVDTVHVILNYPVIGGMDTVFHHLTFILISAASTYYALMP